MMSVDHQNRLLSSRIIGTLHLSPSLKQDTKQSSVTSSRLSQSKTGITCCKQKQNFRLDGLGFKRDHHVCLKKRTAYEEKLEHVLENMEMERWCFEVVLWMIPGRLCPKPRGCLCQEHKSWPHMDLFKKIIRSQTCIHINRETVVGYKTQCLIMMNSFRSLAAPWVSHTARARRTRSPTQTHFHPLSDLHSFCALSSISPWC